MVGLFAINEGIPDVADNIYCTAAQLKVVFRHPLTLDIGTMMQRMLLTKLLYMVIWVEPLRES